MRTLRSRAAFKQYNNSERLTPALAQERETEFKRSSKCNTSERFTPAVNQKKLAALQQNIKCQRYNPGVLTVQRRSVKLSNQM